MKIEEKIFIDVDDGIANLTNAIKKKYKLTIGQARVYVSNTLKNMFSPIWKIEGEIIKCEKCGVRLTEKNIGVIGFHSQKKNSEVGYCCDCVDKINKIK